MPIRRLRQLNRGDFVPRSICSTGAEVAAAAAIPELGLIATPALASSAVAAGIPASMLAANFVPAAGGAAGLFGSFDPVSLGLQAGGTLLRGQAAADAADRRAVLTKALGAYQTGNAKKSTALTGKYIEGATPEARAAALSAAENEARTGYERTIGASGAQDRPVAGKLSEQYSTAQSASADAISRRTKAIIENLSKMRAPGVAGAAEARRYGLAAGDVDALNSANENVGRAFGSDVENVQASPWAMEGANLLSGIGQGLAEKKRKREGAL